MGRMICSPTDAPKANGLIQKVGGCGSELVPLPGGGHACPKCDGPVTERAASRPSLTISHAHMLCARLVADAMGSADGWVMYPDGRLPQSSREHMRKSISEHKIEAVQ